MKYAHLVSTTFNNALNTLLKKELPAVTALKLTRLVKFLESEHEVLERTRLTLLKQFGELDDSGNVKIEDNNYIMKKPNDFRKEYTNLLDTDLKAFERLPLSLFEHITIKPADLQILIDTILTADL